MAKEPKPIHCSHPLPEDARQVCAHLLENAETAQFQYFSGESKKYALICTVCRNAPDLTPANLQFVCPSCFDLIDDESWWEGIVGQPLINDLPCSLHFQHRTITELDFDGNELIDIQPVVGTSKSEWIGLTASNTLLRINLEEPASVTALGTVTTPDNQSFQALELGPHNRLAVLYQPRGLHGVVVELESLQQRKHLLRDGYHADVSPFSIAFFIHEGRELLIYSPEWNRLDIYDPWTDELLTGRESPVYQGGVQRSEHYLDYFHGNLNVSPNHQWIADDGWIWHPVGAVTTWNLQRWLTANVWESENGSTKHMLCTRYYFWDGPMCWIDNQTLAVWGYGEDEEWLIPAVRLFDVVSGSEKRWFAGPDVASQNGKQELRRRDALIFDQHLFSVSAQEGVQVWDVETGDRLLADSSFFPRRYNKGTQEFLTVLPTGALQVSRLIDKSAG